MHITSQLWMLNAWYFGSVFNTKTIKWKSKSSECLLQMAGLSAKIPEERAECRLKKRKTFLSLENISILNSDVSECLKKHIISYNWNNVSILKNKRILNITEAWLIEEFSCYHDNSEYLLRHGDGWVDFFLTQFRTTWPGFARTL